jgi:thymidine phosphorylase
VRDLGGGRLVKGAAVDPEVGVDALLAFGEPVSQGAPIARVHAASRTAAEAAAERVREAFRFSNSPGLKP